MKRILRLGSAAAAAVAFMAGGGNHPAASGDREAGRDLVGRWCVSCHATGAAAKAVDTAPTFTAIANDPVRTPARLKLWLADPHPPMPNLSLSRDEIDNILTYFDTLKTR